MFDAMGKPPIGLFQGNLNWIGQYDQCNLIQVRNTSNVFNNQITMPDFDGSYCDIKMEVPKELNIPTAVRKLYLVLKSFCMVIFQLSLTFHIRRDLSDIFVVSQ